MKHTKIGTITFHSSYNHGSCLQAYALQTFVSNLFDDCTYEIINLRTPIQKEKYKSIFKKKGLKNTLKKVAYFGKSKMFDKKAERYEKFIRNRLNCTKEYGSFDEIKKAGLDYDYYISGSDQLWNLAAKDFDWSYYLEFTESSHKISYAASFGPLKREWTKDEAQRIGTDLRKYAAISVREEGSADAVEQLIGKRPPVHVDPTLLLKEEEWNKLVCDEPVMKGDYIFLYDLKNKPDTYKLAKSVSKALRMPVVIVASSAKNHLMNPGLVKKYDAGPEEFLNLVKNAKLILSSSFHGTVFSIIFRKPFYSINGASDNRISNLLKRLDLSDRCITLDTVDKKIEQAFMVDFSGVREKLDEETVRAKRYLKAQLGKKA